MILYMPCHSVLEYDELRIFEQIGVQYFSFGSYINPQQPVDPIRPALTQKQIITDGIPPQDNLTPEFLNHFSHIIIMHRFDWLKRNWTKLKGRNVYYRSIGQSAPHIEQELSLMRTEGLQIIRYSTEERHIPNYAGEDAVIYFFKDENEYTGYTGEIAEVYTMAQDFKHRAEHVNYNSFITATQGLPRKVYGLKNEELGKLAGGYMTYDKLKELHRTRRVFFYAGTQPAQYTLTLIEAMMTGTPIVAIGPKLATSLGIAGGYEIPNIIINEVSGYYSDDIPYLKAKIEELLNDKELAKRIGQKGRKSALLTFSMQRSINEWRELLNA